MNGFSLNSSALNGAGIVATLIYLPAVSGTIQIDMTERNSAQMSGSAGLSFATFGDLSRLSIVGDANTGITITTAGTMSAFAGVNLGSAPTGIDLATAGTMFAGVAIPVANTGITLTTAATLLLTGGLSGSTGLDIAATGTLTAKIYLGPDNASINIDTSGTLRGLVRLTGATAIEFSIDGDPVSLQLLQGGATIAITTEGSLSVNAFGDDLDANTLIRPFTDREMTRLP